MTIGPVWAWGGTRTIWKPISPIPPIHPDTQQIRTFHLATSCIYNTSAAWLESHGNANRFDTSDSAPLLLDGFVHTAAGLAIFDGDPDTKGVRSMGYYTQADLPSPYWFATQFATSDRLYNPEPAQTEDTAALRHGGNIAGAGASARKTPTRS